MKEFLLTAGWSDAVAQPLAGDASSRRYTRLTRGAESAILMDDPEGDVALFARLARHLLSIGLSAPRVLAEAPGLLLLEDLGDGLLARLCTDVESEKRLYLVATDALIALHRHAPPENLPVADAAHLSQITGLAFDAYVPGTGAPQDPQTRDAVIAALHDLIAEHAPETDVMILRDYHAENILWLPGRDGAARAGLLDFQDALKGPRAYDLISLIRDARRDVSAETAEACIRHYLGETGADETRFRSALAVLGVQRSLRILGIFASLAKTRGKPQYIDLIPRVWGNLQTDLAHPAVAELRALLARSLPAPTPETLERLKS
ncbi:phosphotransferase [Yangia mangrovi]|uniref:Phosphotransferase n=1 Tax=Alloyangia mangrovi TaxID=1779329 RepID=A0A2A3JNV7_9RHOB|nr:phosphotransferase [Alloyangia mangrovi]MCT4369702.1 phosphotransferase [Alloyangia mangrovi]